MALLGVTIRGSASFLPGAPVGNAELVERHGLPCTAEWIEEWTGLKSRHRAQAPLTATDMALAASRAALEDAGLSATALERILVASSTGDRPMPGLGNELQDLLGARCDAMDLRNGCHSFLAALDLATRCVVTGTAPILVVATECGRGRLNPDDRRSFPLFGDGAGAIIVDRSERGGVLGQYHRSYGRWSRAIWIPGPLDDEPGPQLRMSAHGRTFRKEVPLMLEEVIGGALADAGLGMDDISRVIPHQPNPRWTLELLARFGVREQQVKLFAAETGNLSSVMLPLGLDLHRRGAAPPAQGERLLLFTVGAGAAAGAMVWEVA